MSKQQNQLFTVISNYQNHLAALQSDSQSIANMAATLCSIDLFEMWCLTQELIERR